MQMQTKYAAALFAVAALAGISAPGAVAADQTDVHARSVNSQSPATVDASAKVAFFHIVNRNSDKCMDPIDGNVAGSKLVQTVCDNTSVGSQDWSVTDSRPDANGSFVYRIVNAYSGQCAVPSGSEVIQAPCGDSADQFWYQEVLGGGYYRYVNYGSGQCLGIQGASKDTGAAVIQAPCNDLFDHQWYL